VQVLDLLASAIGLLVLGAVVSALLARRRLLCGYVAAACAVIASVAVAYVGLVVSLRGPVEATYLSLAGMGLEASLHLRVDGLSAIFLMVTALVAVCSAVYAVRYVLRYEGETLLRYYPFMLLFVASVVAVVSAWDMVFFIVFWELMTLLSYVLVVYEKRNPSSLRAGLRYFITTHIATACMILAVAILYVNAQPEHFGLEALGNGLRRLLRSNPVLVHVVLALFFVGFATKAGVLPFGFWLPDAYPAAPSSASALFAGTMTKLGVYGIVRVFVTILQTPTPCADWGRIIAAFGALSIFIGTVTALLQHDSKRLLSFHIIGQVGYMLLGVGLGIAFIGINPALAVIGLVGGLFHVVNHACYKSLLFLNAGAALYRTGTRDLNKAGGLIGIMPLTGVAAIVASLSIAGVPPFSGFSSKWLLFSGSLLAGLEQPLFLVLGVVAIFVSVVTLASFLKFLGTVFLGRLDLAGADPEKPRIPFSMKAPQVIIGVFCVLFGVYPMLPLRVLHGAVAGILPPGYAPGLVQVFGASPVNLSVNVGEGFVGFWGPLWVVPVLLGGLLIAALLYSLSVGPVKRDSVWLCGEQHRPEVVKYRAHSFYLPFRDFLAFRVGSARVSTLFPQLPKPRVGEMRWLRRAVNFDEWLYYPLLRTGRKFLELFRESHVGVPQVYVLWMAIGVVLAIIILYALS